MATIQHADTYAGAFRSADPVVLAPRGVQQDGQWLATTSTDDRVHIRTAHDRWF
jgi:hypothetical protein